VMVGMALLGLLAAQSAWRAWFMQVQPSDSVGDQVPTAHW